MPNHYIEHYQKQRTSKQSEVSSICYVLEKLIDDIKFTNWVDEKQLSTSNSKSITFFTSSGKQPTKTSIESVLEKINTLVTKIKQIAPPNYLSLIHCLAESYYALSATEEIREFMIYLLTDIDPYSELPNAEAALKTLLKRKYLSPDFFKHTTISIDSIDKHTECVFNNIYKHRYANTPLLAQINPKLPRFSHGIQHVSRVAIYIPILANLYRKYNHIQALQLTQRDVHLLQIAALLHDSGRQADGKDYWDQDSAIFAYYYLTQILREDHATAKLMSEAIANKDPLAKNCPLHFEININSVGNQISWGFFEGPPSSHNIFQDILGDADRLDVIRSRDHFDAEQLIFYQKIAAHNPIAFEDMARLITEVRSLIALGGDTCRAYIPKTKERYNTPHCHQLTLQDLSPETHPILYQFKQFLVPVESLDGTKPEVIIPPYDPKAKLDEVMMRNALDNGLVFARAVTMPSKINYKKAHPPESNAALEIRKMMRSPQIPTRSGKLNIDGNPFRSASLIGYGASIYGPAGGLRINPPIEAIQKVSCKNIGSGFGKKKEFIAAHIQAEPKVVQENLNNLFNLMKKGGYSHRHKDNTISTHIEVLMTVNRFDAIYYSTDPNRHNKLQHENSGYPIHPDAPLLQALFIRIEYEKQYQQSRENFHRTFQDDQYAENQFNQRFGNATGRLPIFKYSNRDNRITLIPEENLTETHLLALWVNVCSNYLNELLHHFKHQHRILWLSSHQIKIFSVYGISGSRFMPLDSNYPIELQEKINAEINRIRQSMIEIHHESFLKVIKNLGISFFYDELFFFELLNDFSLKDCFPADIINAALDNTIPRGSLFKGQSMHEFIPIEANDESFLNLLEQARSLDEIKSSSYKNQELYFSNNLIKLHALCEIFERKEALIQIRQQAQQFFLNHISIIYSHIHSGSFVKLAHLDSHALELIQLESFVRIFQIEDVCNKELNSLRNIIFVEISRVFYKANCLREGVLKENITAQAYCELIQGLSCWASFKDNIDKKAIESILNLLIYTLTEIGSHPLDAYKYDLKVLFDNTLYLASFIGKKIKMDINTFLMRCDDWHEWRLNDAIYTTLFKHIPLNDDNLDLFSILLQRNIFSTREDNTNHLLCAIIKLKALQGQAPNALFSPNQLEIIKIYSEIYAKEYSQLLIEKFINAQDMYSCGESLALLVCGLSAIKDLSFDFNIPSQFIDALHQGLESYCQHNGIFTHEINVSLAINSGIEQLTCSLNQLIEWLQEINNKLLSAPNPEINTLITRINTRLIDIFDQHEEIETQQETFSP